MYNIDNTKETGSTLDNKITLDDEAALKFKEAIIQAYVKYVNETDVLINNDENLRNCPAFISKRCELTREIKVIYGSHGLL
ncbi:MAG: hypothetical protein ACLQQ4_08925 [Bacteroidia bacterium]